MKQAEYEAKPSDFIHSHSAGVCILQSLSGYLDGFPKLKVSGELYT